MTGKFCSVFETAWNCCLRSLTPYYKAVSVKASINTNVCHIQLRCTWKPLLPEKLELFLQTFSTVFIQRVKYSRMFDGGKCTAGMDCQDILSRFKDHKLICLRSRTSTGNHLLS